ncbi:MAG: endonuclease MutS2 [Lachnospiraceae bacterium]|nr:endonuclease MutS2 [Cuneatibacter sp.]MDD6455266.1 endonuclease MutS2 [Lachnospiraceae bacterium]
MNEKALRVLEYSKIIEMLTEHATTPLGKAQCAALVPSDDRDEISRNLKETTDAVSRLFQKGSISFSGARDIRPSISRLAVGSSLSISELLSVSSLLTAAARAKNYGRRDVQEEERDSLDDLFDSIAPLSPLNREIERCILSEEEIADDASPGLHRVRRSMASTKARVHTQMNSILNSSRNYLQDAVITMRNGRYCIPVKQEYKGQVSGMVHDQSSSGSTVFIEPAAVVKLNNELRELEIQEQKEIEAVLAELSNQCAEYTEDLKLDLQVLSHLDFVFAKAALSRSYKGSCPRLSDKGYLNIKKGRHPLIDPHKVVPIDVTLGLDYHQLIITGPNTGGKTVTLKTVGLFCLMGQAGLHIPAFDGSTLPVYREVFADIGDEQSIEQSLSTFSSHMVNIVSFLDKADSDCLVLFDELGAGTDPTEGAALATAILSFLRNLKVTTMATTHYSELKVYALSTEDVENACCEFDVETLQPTYRLLVGIPGKSNAFAISSRLGIPDYIIEDAKQRLDSEDVRFEDLIASLEEDRKQIEKAREEAEKSRAEADALRKRFEERQAKFDAQRERLLQKANEEAQSVLQEAKDYVDQTIRRVNKRAAGSGFSKELEADRTELRGRLNEVGSKLAAKPATPKKKAPAPRQLRVGDGVRVLTLNLNGTVSTLPNAKGDLYVQMGILRSLVNIKDIELLDEASVTGDGVSAATGKSKTPRSNTSSIKMSKSSYVSPEINLIGKTVDEALPELDKYLDDAYLAHLPQVRVVHGRGTGALRKGVHQHLRRLDYVKSFRLGEFGEGDTGVTLVEFK